MANETGLINAPVTIEEFCHYFVHKKEIMESFPTGRHIGHYKAILDNDNLVRVVVAMLNIWLSRRIALENWKHTTSVMLENNKGSPKLDRLRIIQLFEADYNFFLALAFRHFLIRFACKHCGFNDSQYGRMNGKQEKLPIINKILTRCGTKLQ